MTWRSVIGLAAVLAVGCGAREERLVTATTVTACAEASCEMSDQQRVGVRVQLRACEAAIAAGCPTPAAVD